MTYIADPNRYWAKMTTEGLQKSLQKSKDTAVSYFYENDKDSDNLNLKMEFVHYLDEALTELLEDAKNEFPELHTESD